MLQPVLSMVDYALDASNISRADLETLDQALMGMDYLAGAPALQADTEPEGEPFDQYVDDLATSDWLSEGGK